MLTSDLESLDRAYHGRRRSRGSRGEDIVRKPTGEPLTGKDIVGASPKRLSQPEDMGANYGAH